MNFMAQMYGVDLHRGSGLTSCSFACSGAAKERGRLLPGVPVPRPRQMRLRRRRRRNWMMTRWLALACRGQWGSPGVVKCGKVASAGSATQLKLRWPIFFKERPCSMLMGTQGWGLHWTMRISCHWGHEVSGHDRSELALEQTLHCRGMTRAFGSFWPARQQCVHADGAGHFLG